MLWGVHGPLLSSEPHRAPQACCQAAQPARPPTRVREKTPKKQPPRVWDRGASGPLPARHPPPHSLCPSPALIHAWIGPAGQRI